LSSLSKSALTAAGIIFSAVAAISLSAHYVPISNHFVMFLAALFPYLSLTSIPAILAFLAARRWTLAALCTALLTALLAVQLPLYVPADRISDSVQVRVLTANLYLGQADDQVIGAAAEQGADIIAVEELTPTAAQRLSVRLAHSFPYQVIDARGGAGGVGLWSRFPLLESRRIPGYQMAMVSTRLQIPGAADPTVLVAHISGPWPQPINDWQQDLQHLGRQMHDLAAADQDGAVMVMGDFNSTVDMRPFRQVMEGGYQDAAEQAGTGTVATYPGNSSIPPIIGIDHVITYRCTAISVSAVRLPGSDHRGLMATLELPRTSARGS
jgi:endonuclease/exonuclease/phosphatase (EEP) superfamily protein YafD